MSAAVDQLVSWPHVGALEVLRLANWRAEAAGSVRRLFDALDGARLRGLHVTDCGKACTTQVVEALAAGSWPALRAVSLSALNESLIEPLTSSDALSQLEEVSLQRTRLEEDALSRLLRGLGSAHIAQLDLDHLTSPSLAQGIAEAFPSVQRLWVAFGEGGLEAFCEHAAGNGLLELVSHKQLDRRAGLSAGDCRALAAWPNSLRRLELICQCRSLAALVEAGRQAFASTPERVASNANLKLCRFAQLAPHVALLSHEGLTPDRTTPRRQLFRAVLF